MAFELVDCFRDLCEQRKTLSKELVVADDRGVSYSGFLLLDKDDTPCVSNNISSRVKWCYDKYDTSSIRVPRQDGGLNAFICLYRGKLWHSVADE